MESWRKFLVESNSRDDIKLYDTGGGDVRLIILYKILGEQHLTDSDYVNVTYVDRIEVVAAIKLATADKIAGKPCIPTTYQVDTVVVEEEYEGQGFQKLLMDFAFLVNSETKDVNGETPGLTSDHQYGTKEKAARAWEKIEATFEKDGEDLKPDSSSSYELKKTYYGNTKFDYLKKTPDPMDDCYDAGGKQATDYSYIKKNPEEVRPEYEEMSSRHDKFVSEKVQKSPLGQMFFKNALRDLFGKLFSRRYR